MSQVVHHQVDSATGPVWTRFQSCAIFLARCLKDSTFYLCFRCFLHFFCIFGHMNSSTKSSSMRQKTCSWIYCLDCVSADTIWMSVYISSNFKQSESWFIKLPEPVTYQWTLSILNPGSSFCLLHHASIWRLCLTGLAKPSACQILEYFLYGCLTKENYHCLSFYLLPMPHAALIYI